MPVRIYDIAKKLGLENRVVLVKAKELGIAAAKVASSSLDKITAEYLEQQLAPFAQAPTAAMPVDESKVEIISAPAVPKPEAPSPEPPPAAVPASVSGNQLAPAGTTATIAPSSVQAPASAAPHTSHQKTHEPSTVEPRGHAADTEPLPTSSPESPTIHLTPASAVVETETAAAFEPQAELPDSVPATQPIPAESGPIDADSGPESVSQPPLEEPPQAPSATTSSPSPSPAAEVASSDQPSAAPQPPAGPKPQLGDKVGFINLSTFARRVSDTRPRDAGGAPAPGAAGRPGQPPPRPGQTPQRPGQAPNQRPGQQGFQRPGQQGFQRPGQQGFQRPTQFGTHGHQRPGQYGGRPQQSSQQGRPNPPPPQRQQLAADAPAIMLRPPIVVRELAEKMGKKPFQVIADLMGMGVFATVTQTIDTEVAIKICAKHGIRFETEKRDKASHVVNAPKEVKVELDQEDREETLKPRPPVITIMGHVDHGKTSLLDVIRKANVVSGEAGGITQHIGAYTIAYPHPQRKSDMMQLTFLDTPGHAAFSAMRARGANVTDIVILVVAANDGVMPQTLEALSHAKAAKVPIIVAVNKMDHPNANPMRVRQQLQDKGLVPDDWGGDTLYVDCSAHTKVGIDKLIDSILLQAELLELKANPDRKAKGNVIESGVEPGGPVATVLVRKGTLRVGDVILCGQHYGKVRAMMNEEGQRLKEATPSVAVRVLGLNGVPDAGSEFSAVENERAARDLADERGLENKKAELEGVRPQRRTLEDIFGKMSDLSAKVLKVIVKADTQGSVEAICDALQKIESDKVSLEIIHSAVGAVTLHDVQLAASTDGIILGFHTRVDSSAAESAKREGVQIKLYAIIYELIDQVKDAMAGMLDPLLKEVIVGQAEVRKLFELSKGGTVAGCAVTTGRLVRGKMRVRRKNLVIYEGISLTLKRFQDEVSEVRAGMECGVRLDGFDDFQELDVIECYSTEKVTQRL